MKRLLTGIIIFSLLLAMPIYANPADYTYTDNGDGTCTITGYTGTDTNLVIPSSLGGLDVTHIGSFAFQNKGLISVTMPSTLEVIGSGGFISNSSLTSITLNDGLETIGWYAFLGLPITNIVIPDSVTTVQQFAFYVSDLTSVTLSSNLAVIDEMVFGITDLTSISLPEGVEEISYRAFYNSNYLSSVSLPNSLELIEANAFQYCNLISTMQLPSLPPIQLGFIPKWSVSGQSDRNPGDTWDAGNGDIGRRFELIQDPIPNAVTISGTPQVLETFTSTVNITNSRGNLLYQWQRGTTDIPGATGTSYTLTADDAYETIRLKITSDATDNEGEAYSTATTAVTKFPSTITQGIDPVYVDKFHDWIKVQSVQNYEYIAVLSGQSPTGTWSSNPKITGLSDNTTYDVYQRLAEDNLHYASAASNAISVHTPTRLTGNVTINGIFRYKENLTSSVSGSNNTGTLNYQWQRNGNDIPGANSSDYYIDIDDIGYNISLEVTSTAEVDEINSSSGYVTKLINGKKPKEPKVTRITHDYIVVKEQDGYEYRLDTGSWSDSHVLYGVQPEREYKVFQRIKESQTTLASIVSGSVTVETPEEPPPEPASRYVDAMLDTTEGVRFGFTKIIDDYDLANTVIDNRHAAVIAETFNHDGQVKINLSANASKNQIDITPAGLNIIRDDEIEFDIETSVGQLEFKSDKLDLDVVETLFPDENFDIRIEINGESTKDELVAVIKDNGYELVGEMIEYKMGLVTGYTTYPIEVVSNVFLRSIPINELDEQYTVVYVNKEGIHHVSNMTEEVDNKNQLIFKSNALGHFAVVKKSKMPEVDHWSKDFVLGAISQGIAEEDVVERLDKPISRDELVMLLHKNTGFTLKEGEAFEDVDDENPYKVYVESARALGIISGIGDNEFDPSGTITREQYASLLYRYFDERGDTSFGDISLKDYSDLENVSIRAGVGMQWAISHGFMSGKAENQLMPQSEITVAEAITILNKLKSKFLE